MNELIVNQEFKVSNIELNIIKYWKDNDIVNKIKLERKDCPKWEFLDGPPFINGNPHLGHILVSMIKDTIARYMSQKGYMITYQIGFDCHGLPLEQEAEKIVGKVSYNDSIDKLHMFNNTCRDIIKNCSNVWYETLGRIGRQFDISQTYHTSNFNYMESLWWAFKKLWDNDLIYCSKKVMPYSPLCETPLSNFEASSNYVERTDISVYVKFKLCDSDIFLMIWTTTPWSLFANQGICVNPDLDYSLIENDNNKYYIATNCIKNLFTEYTVIKIVKGKELAGLKYEPIFNYITNYINDMCYTVYTDSYVDDKSGTGLVHLAPLFGNDDMRVMKKNGYTDNLLPSFIIDTQVRFTSELQKYCKELDINNKFVMDTSTDIVIYLKTNNVVYKSEKIKHSYPYCWRTDHPLVYIATDAWFMNVQKIIPELIENNKKINWYPKHVGTDRFANWIKDSPDWCLSRNRVWGTPIPVWINENGKMLCVGSVKELEELTGNKYDDIHLDKINDVIIKTNEGTLGTHSLAERQSFSGTFKRTFGILDCWFESGMAGLSRFGFPECNNKSYPVDFIAESVDQTRGWFYTLNVLSTALNHTPAFKNVIVSGLILAADGKKMSKRLGNYTSPDKLFETFGADVLRLYLIGCPAAKAESFCFKDSDLSDITRKLLPYYNAHLLLKECIIYTGFTEYNTANLNVLQGNDLWIKNKYYEFAKLVYKNMENFEINMIPNHIFKFIDHLCNIYIKYSREILKEKSKKSIYALSTLYWVLNSTNHLLAPFMPHLSEYFSMLLFNIFPNKMKEYKSVHLKTINFNNINNFILDKNILGGIYSLNELFENIRCIRNELKKPIYYPILYMDLYLEDTMIMGFEKVILSEMNIKKLNLYSITNLAKKYKANKNLIGRVLKKEASNTIEYIETATYIPEEFPKEYYTIEYIVSNDNKDLVGKSFSYVDHMNKMCQGIVYLYKISSIEIEQEAEINNIRKLINNMRKNMGLKIYNKIKIIFENNNFWKSIDRKLIDLLSKRLITDIIFENEMKEYDIIKTFRNTELKIKINIL